jgi:hypothetical protein
LRVSSARIKEEEDHGSEHQRVTTRRKKKIGKRVGIQREQILKVAASIMKACTESGEAFAVQRRALELALKWLKVR